MRKRILTSEEQTKIIALYLEEKKSTTEISTIMHLNKKKIYEILNEHNIQIRKKGELLRKHTKEELEEHNKVIRFPLEEGFTYVAIAKDSKEEFKDYLNVSGVLSKYIKKHYNVEPLSNYKASVYYYENNKYWFEEWFDIIKVPLPSKNVKQDLPIAEIIRLYAEEKQTVDEIATLFHVGKLKIYKILDDNQIPRRKLGELLKKEDSIANKEKMPLKYKEREGFHYIAVSKIDGTTFNDYNNKGGFLTSYINKKLHIEIPSLYERKKYYKKTGNYWYEQWFDIIEIENNKVVKCPYCDWETVDIDNKSGMLSQHIKKEHNKTFEDICKDYPNYINYFKKEYNEILRQKRLNNEEEFVICPICNQKFHSLTKSHIESCHKMKFEDFLKDYPNQKLVSNKIYENILEIYRKGNLSVTKNRFISKYEKEIQNFLTKNNIIFQTNRQILNGREIDILIEDLKLGIEFDGLFFHSEWHGKKDCNYHQNKTDECLKQGYSLIHIFEDEYVHKKEIVYSKLKYLLNLNQDLPKIMGRKCKVKEISEAKAHSFLDLYHIQGFSTASIYLGAFHQDELIAVMNFENKNENWILTRFASNYNYVCQGVCSKLFTYFIRNYKPSTVISFADRRWTCKFDNNIYTKLGFNFSSIIPPDFYYFNPKIDKFKCFPKTQFSKLKLSKLYNFPLSMTESEMAKEAGFDRIWNCGLYKYIWTENNKII